MSRAITHSSVDLSANSALVLLWSGSAPYPMAESLGYFDMLDLSAGEKLHSRCSEIWPGYGEVIRDRKWCISAMADRVLASDLKPEQVVIIGAGLSPLSIELHSRWPHLNIFDVDRSGMDAKCKICSELDCLDKNRVHFIPADIADIDSLHSRLSVTGWDPAKATLVIAEAISYFLPTDILRKAMSIFSDSGKSVAILDYLIHPGNVHFSRRHVPYEIYSVISRHFKLESMSTYSGSSLGDSILSDMLESWTLYDIELARYGQGRQFPSADMGWIEVGLYRLKESV